MLSDVFAYIRSRFYSVAYWFSSIGNWLDAQGWPWKYLSPPFYSLRDLCTIIGDFFYEAYKFTRTIEDILDDAWSKAKQAFDYAYDVLRYRVNDALNAAGDAWDKAVTAFSKAQQVWNYAYNWLTDKAIEAWYRAGNIWGTVTNWLKQQAIEAYNKAVWAYEQIAAAVTAAAQDIYAWVEGIPAEFKTFVDGVVAAFNSWVLGIIADAQAFILAILAPPFNLLNLWFDDFQNFFNDPLGWLSDRFENWFFGPEK